MTISINTKHGKITADQNTLNFISILAREAADEYNREGYDALAKEAKNFALSIYNELEKAGMYKNF